MSKPLDIHRFRHSRLRWPTGVSLALLCGLSSIAFAAKQEVTPPAVIPLTPEVSEGEAIRFLLVMPAKSVHTSNWEFLFGHTDVSTNRGALTNEATAYPITCSEKQSGRYAGVLVLTDGKGSIASVTRASVKVVRPDGTKWITVFWSALVTATLAFASFLLQARVRERLQHGQHKSRIKSEIVLYIDKLAGWNGDRTAMPEVPSLIAERSGDEWATIGADDPLRGDAKKTIDLRDKALAGTLKGDGLRAATEELKKAVG